MSNDHGSTDDERSGSCPCCRRRDPREGQVCDLCRQRTAAALWELRDLWSLLPSATMPGQSSEQRVSGSRELPVPLRLEPLDLAGPADQATRPLFARGLLGLDDAQTGSLSVATILQTRTEEWATLLDVPRPLAEVPTMVSWLARHLSWALDNLDEPEGFTGELMALLYSLRALLNVSRAPTYLHDEACPSCGMKALRREAVYQISDEPGREKSGGGDVVCGNCHRTWPHEDFQRLAVVLADDGG